MPLPPGQAPSHPTPSQRLYLAFVRNCKLTAEHTLPAIHFMQSSLVELARMDPPTTYHHAFVYIRQLAVHLRTAISSRSKVCYCRQSRMGAFSDPSPAPPPAGGGPTSGQLAVLALHFPLESCAR